MSQSTAGPGGPDFAAGDPSDVEEVTPDSHAADVDAGFDDDEHSPTETIQTEEDGSL